MSARPVLGGPRIGTMWLLTVGATLASRSANAQQAHRPDSQAMTAFVNVGIVPMDRERVLEHQTLVVRGDRIAALGPTRQIRVPAGAARVDGQGKFLLPGLANMHTHLQSDDPIDSVPSRATREWILLNYLADGITTVRNMNGRPWHVALREQVARGDLLGPRIYTAGPMLGEDRPLPTPAVAIQAVAEQRAAGYDFLKVYSQVESTEIFDSLVAAAARAHMPFGGHVPPKVGLEHMLRAHPVSIEHLTGYFEYVTTGDSSKAWFVRAQRGEVDESKIAPIARATREAGVWNCPTLKIAGRFYRVPDLAGQIVKALHDAGAGLLLGTDGGPHEEELPIAAELQTLVGAGLTPYQALETGTRNPARFFGTLDSTGTVVVGKRADLVLLSGNPLQDIQNVAQPVGVMVGGQWRTREALEARLQALMPPSATSTGAPAP